MAYRIYWGETQWRAYYTPMCVKAGHSQPCELHERLIAEGVAKHQRRLDEAHAKSVAAGDDPDLRYLRPEALVEELVRRGLCGKPCGDAGPCRRPAGHIEGANHPVGQSG